MPTPILTVYDFDQVTVQVGPVLVDGFGDSDGVSVEQDAETFSYKVGQDGKVTRSKTLNRVAKVTITLQQSSLANDKLSALHLLDRDGPGGAGVVPLSIRDRNGRAMYEGAQCWIQKPPMVDFKTESTQRVWEIIVSELIRVDGGN